MLSARLQHLRPLFNQLHLAMQWLRPYLHLCHLHRPVDLILLLLPALWTLSLAQQAIRYSEVIVLLLSATAFRCAAWVYNDLHDASNLQDAPESFITLGLIRARDGWRLLAALLSFSAIMLLFLGSEAFAWGAMALVLLLSYPHIKSRTLLTQLYMGFCFAWMVAMTQMISPGIAAKSLWLLFTATLLWATANTLLYAIPRRAYEERLGIGSLASLFGDNTSLFVLILQIFSVIALWFVGKQAGLGDRYAFALLAALALLPYQQWLLAKHPGSGAIRAYRSNILFGLVILAGLFGEQL